MGLLTETTLRLRGEISALRHARVALQSDLVRETEERRTRISALCSGFARDREGARRAWFGPTVSERRAAERQLQGRLAEEAAVKERAEDERRVAEKAAAKARAEDERRLAEQARAKAHAEEQRRLAEQAAVRAHAEEQRRLAEQAQAEAQAEEERRVAGQAAENVKPEAGLAPQAQVDEQTHQRAKTESHRHQPAKSARASASLAADTPTSTSHPAASHTAPVRGSKKH